jgi:hypothetical protein
LATYDTSRETTTRSTRGITGSHWLGQPAPGTFQPPLGDPPRGTLPQDLSIRLHQEGQHLDKTHYYFPLDTHSRLVGSTQYYPVWSISGRLAKTPNTTKRHDSSQFYKATTPRLLLTSRTAIEPSSTKRTSKSFLTRVATISPAMDRHQKGTPHQGNPPGKGQGKSSTARHQRLFPDHMTVSMVSKLARHFGYITRTNSEKGNTN